MTYIAFNFCDLGWLPILLSWLLPFLLGLLLGYAIWAKYKKMMEDLEVKIKGLNSTIVGLESDIDACKHKRTDLESEIAMLKGQLRERDLKISTLEASLAASSKKGSGGKVSSALAGAAITSIATGDKKKKKDDLTKIEGVGSKIEKLLNDDDIRTYNGLADTKVGKLRKILDTGGPKFLIAKPDSWPEQAALARDGKWDELKKLQGQLIGGVKSSDKLGSAAAKDDLKLIEGIGPKIAGLMNDAGIWTFDEMSKADVSKLKGILDAAGPRYRIATPDTWPEQASLAKDGKWDQLEIFQKNLKGGRKA